MKKNPSDKELENEVQYFIDHQKEIADRQRKEREEYRNDPANAERLAAVRQRLKSNNETKEEINEDYQIDANEDYPVCALFDKMADYDVSNGWHFADDAPDHLPPKEKFRQLADRFFCNVYPTIYSLMRETHIEKKMLSHGGWTETSMHRGDVPTLFLLQMEANSLYRLYIGSGVDDGKYSEPYKSVFGIEPPPCIPQQWSDERYLIEWERVDFLYQITNSALQESGIEEARANEGALCELVHGNWEKEREIEKTGKALNAEKAAREKENFENGIVRSVLAKDNAKQAAEIAHLRAAASEIEVVSITGAASAVCSSQSVSLSIGESMVRTCLKKALRDAPPYKIDGKTTAYTVTDVSDAMLVLSRYCKDGYTPNRDQWQKIIKEKARKIRNKSAI